MSRGIHCNSVFQILISCIGICVVDLDLPSGLCAVPTVSRVYPAGCQIGQTSRITITSNQDAKRLNAWCGRPGVRFESTDKPNTFNMIVPADTTPGLCWLRFFNDEGVTDPVAFILGLRAETVESEPNEHFVKATPVDRLPVVMNGILEKSADVDCFGVTLVAGQTLIASVTAHELLGSPVDCVLQVVSDTGFVLAQNDDDHGNDPQIAFTAKSTGKHVVRLFGFPEKPNSSIRFASAATYVYRLSLTVGSFVDHTVPLFLENGPSAAVDAVGWNLAAGAKVTATIPNGETQAVAFHGNVDNWRFLPTLRIPAIRETRQVGAQQLTLPFALTACLNQPNERDQFEFEGRKGESLRIRCLARSIGQPTDPLIRILNAAGSQLQEQDDASRGKPDCDLTFKVPVDGKYAVEVRDRFDGGGWRYAYLLIVEKPQADFEITLSAGRFTVASGKPLEIPVTVSRMNGFSEAIEISVNGLPAGVSAPPVTSLAKGATSKAVKLVLTSDGSVAANVAISIQAKAGNIQRLATAPSGIGEQRIESGWLTAIRKKPAAKTTKKSN